MKYLGYIGTILSLMVVTVFSACDDGTKTTEEEIFFKKMSATWALTDASADGKNVLSYFPGFTLTTNGDKTYSVANAVDPMWKSSGTFDWQSGPSPTVITRDDGTEITVSEISENKLVMTFAYNASGRTRGLSGQYTFTFEK